VKRTTFTLDERDLIRRLCADAAVAVSVVDPCSRLDRLYRRRSTDIGHKNVNEEIDGCCD
jgi:hypothetical protein